VTPTLIVEADGGSRGNPGPAGFGALVRDAATGEVLREASGSIGTATNNVAEYSGLIAGLRAAAEIAPGADVEVRMDSKLVVEQMSGRWQIKHESLRALARTAREAAAGLGQLRYIWVPRARNAYADRLANEAMDAARRDQPGSGDGPGTLRSENVVTQPPAAPSAAAPAPAAGGWGRARGEATTTILLRHGQTEMSVERRFAGRGDIPLTETGERQAAAAASRLTARRIDAIVTSPLQRARRTAEAVATATGAPLATDDGLAETDFGAALAGGDHCLAGQRGHRPAGRRELRRRRAAGARRAGPGARRAPGRDRPAGQPCHADQDAGLPRAAGPDGCVVPDSP
jgi:probable phosphoglycerate mutase